jgi:isopenicillin N synthase-like dioxygenase
MDEVLQVGREFFARPQEEKERIRLENSDGVRGERTRGFIVGEKAAHWMYA